MRSAWRKTVTFALSSQVDDSGSGDSAATSDLSGDADTLPHSVERISAALSASQDGRLYEEDDELYEEDIGVGFLEWSGFKAEQSREQAKRPRMR